MYPSPPPCARRGIFGGYRWLYLSIHKPVPVEIELPAISDRLSRVRYDQFGLEDWVKRFWAENRVYRLVKEKSESSNRKFYFLDGPPYASAKSIHVGTAWNKVIKDVVLRYHRMMGYRVWDKPGYDTHGLPIEVKIEKELGIWTKKEIIEKVGVEKFVEHCKRFALENLKAMTEHFKEIGVFMDWDNPYVTFEKDYIESGWWLIKRAWEQGLLYEGYRVVHWCPRCETTLADYEVSEYAVLTDPSIYVKFPVKGMEKTSLLVWTTTPWTLPANAFVMAHPDLEYVKVLVNGEYLILAKARLEKVMEEAGATDYKVVEEFKGKDLEGLEYKHPLEGIVPAQDTLSKYHRVVMAPEAVVATEGTGLVHSAPGHGEIDYEINMDRVGAPVVSLVDNQGRMTEGAGKYKGLYFRKEANKAIIEDLERLGALFHKTTVTHRYPICWRCKTPLVLRATNQWFIAVSKLRDKLLEEAERIEWVPEWAKTRFTNLLREVRDWVISRQRFWGIPLPVWRCKECGYTHVVGSTKELVEMGGEEPEDLHRPWVDRVKLKCPKCGGVMERVPDVMDVWFDSGVAFYASLGYPKNREPYESLKPVDFIVEGHDQIRGWFFSLLRSGIIGFNERPYLKVLVHGFALDEHGREMHKSLGNYIEFTELISRMPRDAVRLWSMQNTIWEDLRFQWKAMEQARRALNIVWNVYSFASTYMSLDKYDPLEEPLEKLDGDWLELEDKWILSRLSNLKEAYHRAMKSYRLHEAARALREFMVEDVSHWYIRLIRRRVWEEAETPTKKAAYAVLHKVLWEWLLLAAPFIPFTTEYIYQLMYREALKGPVSIHLLDLPGEEPGLRDTRLEEAMETAKEIVEAVAAARNKARLKLRQPVSRVIVSLKKGEEAWKLELTRKVILSLANAKELELVGPEFFEGLKVYDVEPNYRAIGPEFRRLSKKIVEYIEANKERVARDLVEKGAHKALVEGEEIVLEPRHVNIKAGYPEWLAVAETDIGLVAVDARIGRRELVEGIARDLVRRIQAMRKEMDLPVEAKIRVWLTGDNEVIEAAREMEEYISYETRAEAINYTSPPENAYTKEWDIDGYKVTIGVEKASDA